jgi:hypothetical protein
LLQCFVFYYTIDRGESSQQRFQVIIVHLSKELLHTPRTHAQLRVDIFTGRSQARYGAPTVLGIFSALCQTGLHQPVNKVSTRR